MQAEASRMFGQKQAETCRDKQNVEHSSYLVGACVEAEGRDAKERQKACRRSVSDVSACKRTQRKTIVYLCKICLKSTIKILAYDTDVVTHGKVEACVQA